MLRAKSRKKGKWKTFLWLRHSCYVDAEDGFQLLVAEYDRMAEAYDVHAAPHYVSSARELLSLASPSEGQVALDLGCGTGNVAFQIAERLGPEGLVVGIDLAEGMVRLAAKKAAQKGLSYVRFLRMVSLPQGGPPWQSACCEPGGLRFKCGRRRFPWREKGFPPHAHRRNRRRNALLPAQPWALGVAEMGRGGESGIRGAGIWIILSGILFIIGFLIHPPGEGVSNAQTMQIVRTSTTAWTVSHALVGLASIFVSFAALIVLVSRSNLTGSPIGVSGWAVLAVLGVPLSLLVLTETTVITDVALANDADAFNQWYGGFLRTIFVVFPLFILGFFLITVHEIRDAAPLLPRWASGVAGAGALIAIGFPLGSLFGVAGLTILFVAFLAPVLWLLALGVQLARKRAAT